MNSIDKFWLDWINNKNKDNCNLGDSVKKGLYSAKIKLDDISTIVNILNEGHKQAVTQQRLAKLPYVPECKYGHEDCIHDAGYGKHYYPNRQVSDCSGCVDSCWYDDEDK